eukprot:g3738.t1
MDLLTALQDATRPRRRRQRQRLHLSAARRLVAAQESDGHFDAGALGFKLARVWETLLPTAAMPSMTDSGGSSKGASGSDTRLYSAPAVGELSKDSADATVFVVRLFEIYAGKCGSHDQVVEWFGDAGIHRAEWLAKAKEWLLQHRSDWQKTRSPAVDAVVSKWFDTDSDCKHHGTFIDGAELSAQQAAHSQKFSAEHQEALARGAMWLRCAAADIQMSKLRWVDAQAVGWLMGGEGGAYLVRLGDSEKLLVKRCPGIGVVVAEMLANMLGVRSAQLRFVAQDSPEYAEASRALLAAAPDEIEIRGRLSSARGPLHPDGHPMMVMKYVHGEPLDGVEGSRLLRRGDDRLLRTLGRTIAMDCFMNNWDRFPALPKWPRKGNLGNVLVVSNNDDDDYDGGATDLVFIDQSASLLSKAKDRTSYFRALRRFIEEVSAVLSEPGASGVHGGSSRGMQRIKNAIRGQVPLWTGDKTKDSEIYERFMIKPDSVATVELTNEACLAIAEGISEIFSRARALRTEFAARRAELSASCHQLFARSSENHAARVEECLDFADLGNRDRNISSGAFQGLGALTSLNLEYNDIRHISSGAFQGLGALTRLDIYGGNNIETIDGGAFRGLASLPSLDLYNQKIKTLRSGTFDGLGALTSLGLGNIETIENGTFRGLSSLKTLGFSIKTLRSGTFDGLSALTSLGLGSILETIESGAFRGLASWSSLNLGSQLIKTLRSGTFDGLSVLKSLMLQGNNIETIHDDAFKGLTYIGLANNRLTSLPRDFFKPLAKLSLITITAGNNFGAACPPLVRKVMVIILGETYTSNTSLTASPCVSLPGVTAPPSVAITLAHMDDAMEAAEDRARSIDKASVIESTATLPDVRTSSTMVPGVSDTSFSIYLVLLTVSIAAVATHRMWPEWSKSLDYYFANDHKIPEGHAMRKMQTKLGAAFSVAAVFAGIAIIIDAADTSNESTVGGLQVYSTSFFDELVEKAQIDQPEGFGEVVVTATALAFATEDDIRKCTEMIDAEEMPRMGCKSAPSIRNAEEQNLEVETTKAVLSTSARISLFMGLFSSALYYIAVAKIRLQERIDLYFLRKAGKTPADVRNRQAILSESKLATSSVVVRPAEASKNVEGGLIEMRQQMADMRQQMTEVLRQNAEMQKQNAEMQKQNAEMQKQISQLQSIESTTTNQGTTGQSLWRISSGGFIRLDIRDITKMDDVARCRRVP